MHPLMCIYCDSNIYFAIPCGSWYNRIICQDMQRKSLYKIEFIPYIPMICTKG